MLDELLRSRKAGVLLIFRTSQINLILLKNNGHDQWCRFTLSIGGNNLQFYPNFALFSTLGRMNFDLDFFHVCKLSEGQKKSSPKIEQFLSPNLSEDQKKNLFTGN